jgi:16S rRNA C967 or C1407 C5-methylase (RsmB/RsmF family)
LQGIHNQHFTGDTLTECTSNSEKEAERVRWRSVLGEILPASFRIGKDVPTYYQDRLTHELEALLKEAAAYVPPPPEDETTEIEQQQRLTRDPRAGPLKETATRFQKLQFLPHAYQLGLDRATIRKNPALAALHTWLKQQVGAGYVTRQETVSMVPPVLLNVVSTDTVLDMCAAPGSKTSQLLEDLSCHNTNEESSTTTATAGCLVANDASANRAYMLVHQLRRILHNHPVALITACSAQFFPAGILQFDKILCDVPCTGDGTTRKNIGVWKSWSAVSALSLHALQLSIAEKGAAQLLKTGGTMCYSTCSFNPIENEAVVAELLRQGDGALELVDYAEAAQGVLDSSSGPLKGFRTRPGMLTWKVLCEEETERQRKNKGKKHNAKMQAKRKEFVDEAEAASADVPSEKNDETVAAPSEVAQDPVEKKRLPKFEPASLEEAALLEMAASEGLHYYPTVQDVPESLQKRIRTSAFPPTAEEATKFHLERCIRCLPQDNDTGGFFVALLRKKAPMSATDRRYERKQQGIADVNDDVDEPDVKRARVGSPSDAKEEEQLDDIEQDGEDDADDALDGLDADNKPVRGRARGKPGKVEDFGKDDFAAVNDEIMKPLIEYYGLTNGFEQDLYMARACSESKVIYYVGKPVKHLFDLGIQKRVTIVNTGLKGFMRNNRHVADCAVSYRVCQEGIHFLIPYMTKRKFVIGFEDFRACLSGEGKTIHLSKFSECFREQLKELTPGSFAVVLEGYEDQLDEKLVATMWKCRGDSVDGLVAKVEVDGLLSRLDAIERNED